MKTSPQTSLVKILFFLYNDLDNLLTYDVCVRQIVIIRIQTDESEADMANIRLTLQYDGTRYLGWQRPEKDGYCKTISYRISSVLEKLTGSPVTLYAGAKTEPGVHALEQTVSFVTDAFSDTEMLHQSLNQYLPMDIRVLRCAVAPERFRADLNAQSRTYEYRVCTASVYDIFTSSYTAHIFPAPDITAMKTAAGYLEGRHDFHFFSGARKKKGTEKHLTGITFQRSDDINNDANTLIISLTANDFLYRMPSLIIGSLLEIGQGKRSPESMMHILDGTEKAGAPCEAKGLLLKSVQY